MSVQRKTKMDASQDESVTLKPQAESQNFFVKNGFSGSIKLIFKNITIEPVLFLVMLANSLEGIPTSYLLFQRVCMVDEGHSHQLCQQILYNKTYIDQKSTLQSAVANWRMISIAAGFVPDLIVKLVAGNWSDQHGRKPMIMMCILGIVLRCILLLFVYDTKLAGAKWILIASLPANILSFSAIWSIGMSYISDISPKENRTLRILLMELCLFLGILCGEYGGGTIAQKYGYNAVYILGTSISGLALVTCFLFVEETTGCSNAGFFEKLKDFFNYKHIVESWKTFIRNRDGNAKMHLMLLIASSILEHMLRRCYNAIDVLYTQAMYDWKPKQLARASTIITATQGFFFISSAFLFMGGRKIADLKIAILCFLLTAAGYSITAFSAHVWMFYLGRLLGVFVFIPSIVINSNLTKIVEPTEIGKIMTFRSAALSFFSPESSLIFIAMYKGTQHFFRGFSYLATSILYILPIGFFIIMLVKPLYVEKYQGGPYGNAGKDNMAVAVSDEKTEDFVKDGSPDHSF